MRRLAATIAVSGVLVASATAPALAAPSAARTPICRSATHPRLAAHISATVAAVLAQRRYSVVGLAADDDALGLTCRFHPDWHFYAASVVKVTILSALLLKEGGPAHLTRSQRNLAYLMITQSNNSAATALWNQVGIGGMRRFLYRARMSHTILDPYAWGLTQITAADELTLLHLLTSKGTVLSPASRSYVLGLMARVIASQRWGVPAGAPRDVTVHVKNGWLPYPYSGDWHINSIGAFTGRNISYQIAILTGPTASRGQGEEYGIETIEDAARIINLSIAAV